MVVVVWAEEEPENLAEDGGAKHAGAEGQEETDTNFESGGQYGLTKAEHELLISQESFSVGVPALREVEQGLAFAVERGDDGSALRLASLLLRAREVLNADGDQILLDYLQEPAAKRVRVEEGGVQHHSEGRKLGEREDV